MIFDMLKRLRSVVYLPNDYVCKKVSCACVCVCVRAEGVLFTRVGGGTSADL